VYDQKSGAQDSDYSWDGQVPLRTRTDTSRGIGKEERFKFDLTFLKKGRLPYC
jgi:hypothetical protein